jgi:hypothetical protein
MIQVEEADGNSSTNQQAGEHQNAHQHGVPDLNSTRAHQQSSQDHMPAVLEVLALQQAGPHVLLS